LPDAKHQREEQGGTSQPEQGEAPRVIDSMARMTANREERVVAFGGISFTPEQGKGSKIYLAIAIISV